MNSRDLSFDPVRRGGEGDGQYLKLSDVEVILSDALKAVLYSRLPLRAPTKADHIYDDNASFWRDALFEKHFAGARVILRNFRLTEWLPFAPGRYYTDQAAGEREMAAYMISSSRDEYTPSGKGAMVRGGIGCIRLNERQIRGERMFFLGATSTGTAHQGVPVALPESGYRKVIARIKEDGCCPATLVGSLDSLADEMPSFEFDAEIPRYCFVTNDLTVGDRNNSEELVATAAIMFSTERSDQEGPMHGQPQMIGRSWTFCSFRPGSNRAVLEAAEWLTDYARRYSSKDPTVLTDFDERHRLFPHVEFPLTDIVNGRVNLETLQVYRRHLGTFVNNYIEKYEKIMGDQINVEGSGNIVTNRSSDTKVSVSSSKVDRSHENVLPHGGGSHMKDFNVSSDIVTSLGKIAGLSGIAFGVFLLLFKGVLEKNFLPKAGLNGDQAFHIMFAILLFTFGIAAVGILAWIIGRSHAAGTVPIGGLALLTVLVVVIVAAAVFVGTRGTAEAEPVDHQRTFKATPPTTVWTDPATSLVWAGKDNGANIDWYGADQFCKDLKIDDYSQWRLPKIEELRGLFDPSNDYQYTYHGHPYGGMVDGQRGDNLIKAGVELNSCCAWSGDTTRDANGALNASYYRFQPNRASNDREPSIYVGTVALIRALCVRSP
jgi:hypothetical protein